MMSSKTMKREILVLEDEVIIAQSIKNSIISGCDDVEVSLAYDARKALEIASSKPIDLLIADIRLRDGVGAVDGIDVARSLDDSYDIPVLFLTAYSDDEILRRTSNLNMVAYLMKPFRVEELLIHLRLSRYGRHRSVGTSIDLGHGYRFDERSEELFKDKKRVRLTRKEKVLFIGLLRSKGSVIRKEVIDDALWPGDGNHENVRRQLVYRLKKKVPDLEIKAVKEIGYVLRIDRS